MGKTVLGPTREMIFNVIQFCHQEKAARRTTIDLNKVIERVCAMTGLSRNTVIQIKKEGSTNKGVWSTPEKKSKSKIDDDIDMKAIKKKIRQIYAKRKKIPTLRTVNRLLKKETNFPGGIGSVRELLNELEYEYKESEPERKVLIERQDILGWSDKYLKTMENKTQTHIVDTHESEMNSTVSSIKTEDSDDDDSVDLSGNSKASSDISGIEFLDSDFDYDE